MTRGLARLLRAYTRWLASPRARVPAAGRVLRGVLFVPPFAVAYAIWKLHLRVRGRPVVVEHTTQFGARMVSRLPDLIQMYVYLFGIWEPEVTAFVRRRLSPGDTFVDVGANVGYHVLLASGCVGDAGRVVAIEASPKIFRALGENLSRNGNPPNVRAVNMAASDSCRTLSIYQGPVHNIGLSTTVAGRGLKRETEVAAAPLGDLLEPQEIRGARLVKIDVEGAEDAVLRGMTGFLKSCRDDVEILLELSPQWWSDQRQTALQVLQPLFDAGFHAYRIDNNLWPWRYLWAHDVRSPRRLRELPAKRVKRIDLVLSRLDREEL